MKLMINYWGTEIYFKASNVRYLIVGFNNVNIKDYLNNLTLLKR